VRVVPQAHIVPVSDGQSRVDFPLQLFNLTTPAILTATDLCVTEPGCVARRIVDGGFTPRYDYARATLREVPYDNWREYDPEDSMRFYALRLHEAGLIKSSPQKIIADGTHRHFLNELKT
jgi:NitT/TauT family transport system substrate-binding protein